MWNRGGTKEAGENSQQLPWERKLFYVTGDCFFFFKSQKKGDFGRSRLGSVIPRLLPLNFEGI